MQELARRILLDGGSHDGVIRFLSSLDRIALDGDKPVSWVTITRTGNFHDSRYGNFEISKDMLLSMVANFKAKTYGQDIFFDVAHNPDAGAAAKILELALDGNKLRAQVEWTPYGVDAVKNRGYQYLSAEYHENWKDNERREQHGPTLLGAGLTIRPVIKGLDPIQLSEPGDGKTPTLCSPDLREKLLQECQVMWKELLKSLSEKLKAVKLADAVVQTLVDAADKTLGTITDQKTGEAILAQFEASGIRLAEHVGSKPITLDIKLPQMPSGLDADGVRKLMAEETARAADSAKKLAETKGAKVKLLTDTIQAATGLDDDLKKQLAEEHRDLITPDMSDDQVKALAASQIKHGHDLIAARTLASMGFDARRGSPHITVDDSNQVKALQEEIDKRLYGDMPAYRRYALSEGRQVGENKSIVDKCVALYDAANGRRLAEEYKGWKKLAGGDTVVSDVAVPAIFERTVIREALYQLVMLGLCDVGTDAFSAVVQLPYSYRDTAAAGVAQARKYEGQGIARAAVKQVMEEARPIPQKIAFEVSDELRYLTSNGQLQWDTLAENARNASRIIGEDTERILADEHLNASDQFSVVAVSNEATATANGTNRIFCTDNFPIVRPKKVFDLQGAQVGATLYPIVMTINAVARTEYDGTNTQPAGLYWVLNANLGEFTIVSELGAPTAPTNTWLVVISYSYTTNVHKWDVDLGTLATDAKYDDFLYRFGLRKAVIEDRSYMATVAMMSGTLRTQIEQARQFGANFKRQGTDLMTDGNLGRIKDVPTFRSYAPGLAIGDVRTVIGERGTTRFRMLKPWQMGQLQDQKDANGRFTGKKEAYGDQFIIAHTPTLLKGAFTSMVLFSTAGRIDRVS